MARKKRNKQNSPNATGRKAIETRIKINCLSDNAIIIKKTGENIKVKANNPRETSYNRKAKKQDDFVDTMQKNNSTTSIENPTKKAEKTCQQKNVNVPYSINNRVVNPKAILAEINKPKRKQKKVKKNTMTITKANNLNKINEFKKMLDKIFIGYRHMTAKIEKELNKLGFIILRHNKHLILSIVLNKQPRSITLSATASDKRCGHRIVTKIMKVVTEFYI